MNERFKELMVELKKTVSTERGAEVLIGYDEIEVFAQLIVRECADVADDPEVDMLRLGKAIKHHFGIEE